VPIAPKVLRLVMILVTNCSHFDTMPQFEIKILFNNLIINIKMQGVTNRSRTEIVSQILQIANRSNGGIDDGDGVTKTKIMYNAYLTSAQLKEYMMILTENDLLGYDQ
jgi:predicted transcriptional regulator